MLKMSKRRRKDPANMHFIDGTKCDNCGYFNQKCNVDRYGTCKLCGKTLDKKAKVDYEMFCRLRLWRKK